MHCYIVLYIVQVQAQSIESMLHMFVATFFYCMGVSGANDYVKLKHTS